MEKLDPVEVKLLKENLYEGVQIGQYLDISVLAVGKNAAGQPVGSCAVTATPRAAARRIQAATRGWWWMGKTPPTPAMPAAWPRRGPWPSAC